MKLKLDEETDTLYLRLDESAIVESEEVQPGVVLDFNSDNRVVGIEMLNISKRVEREKLLDFHFQSNLRRSTSLGGQKIRRSKRR